MAPIQAIIDSICTALGANCTPVTVTTLSDYLLPKPKVEDASVGTTAKKRTKAATNAKTKPSTLPTAKSRDRKVQFTDENGNQNGGEVGLSQRERLILATEVVNRALKALSEAIRAPATTQVRQHVSSTDLLKGTSRKALRRSNSLPQSPLQPRSLNRVTSSPVLSKSPRKGPSTTSSNISGYRSTAECARASFACLRSLQAGQIQEIDLPPLQLENGMSVLIGKLIALGMEDLAGKEVRILRRRLDLGDAPKKPLPTKVNGSQISQDLAELLDFSNTALTGAKLGLAISTQLHILRLMASSRKHNMIVALSVLSPSHPSSPTALLLSAKALNPKEKLVRQLQSLSEILLSLCPSIASDEDVVALDPKFSVTPEVAFRLQGFALHNRVLWWDLAGHEADCSKDLYDPFLRCLTTFARRSERGVLGVYQTASTSFQNLQKLWADKPELNSNERSSVLFGICRLLSSLAQEAGCIKDAIRWATELENYAGKSSDSRRAFVITRLATLALKSSTRSAKDEELLLRLLEQLESPYVGSSSDIEIFMTEVSSARRAALAMLTSATPKFSDGKSLGEGVRQMCESLVFLCPRLCLRFLGDCPGPRAATKEMLRYEQNRSFIAKSGLHSIDSTLFLVKNLLGEGNLTWDLLDSRLQDCLHLLNRLDLNLDEPGSDSGVAYPSYYVRISNIYYTHFLNERRNAEGKDSQQLRVLKRSVDCIQARPLAEKKLALSSTKLERMAEMYRTAGRYDELFQVFKRLQDDQISGGSLNKIAAALTTQPLRKAWERDEASTTLARTIHTLLKIQLKYLDPTTQNIKLGETWSVEEQGAFLEQQLLYLCNQTKTSTSLSRLQLATFTTLLSIYDKKVYPIRRLRVLIELMSIRSDIHESLQAEVGKELRMDILKSHNVLRSDDASLQTYWLHYQALAISTVELRQDAPSLELLTNSISKWMSILKDCADLNALEREVDDVAGLIRHLQVIATFLQVQGLERLRITVLQVVNGLSEHMDSASGDDNIVISFVTLGSQWLHLGYSGRAGLALDKAHIHSDRNGTSGIPILQLHVAYAEYLLAIGNIEKAEEYLHRAQAIYSCDSAAKSGSSPTTPEEKASKTRLLATAYLVHSKLALTRGATHVALNHAKQSVRLLRRAWARVEEHIRRRDAASDEATLQSDVDRLATSVSKLKMSTVSISETAASLPPSSQSSFWTLIIPLFRSLNHLSEVYAHHGMFQETIYYAEQGYNMVKGFNSEAHQAMASTLMGNIYLRSGSLDKGSEMLLAAKEFSLPLEKSRDTALLAHYMGNMYGTLGDRDAELASYQVAENTVDLLLSDPPPTATQTGTDLEKGMEELSLSSSKGPAKRKAPDRSKPDVKGKKTSSRSKSPIPVVQPPISEECSPLRSLKSTILRSKVQVLNVMKQFKEAQKLLEGVTSSMKTQVEVVDHRLTIAKQLLLESLGYMTADPVYSVLQDSTISFPSVAVPSRGENIGDKLSVVKTTPPKRAPAGRSGRAQIRPKSAASTTCFEKLCQAQEYLMEAHSIAIVSSPMDLIHKLASLLNSVSILLSASGYSKGKAMASPAFASAGIEMARNLALRRERKTILLDSSPDSRPEDSSWPTVGPTEEIRSSLILSQDLSRFQKDYIDIIPSSWTAVSISLSESQNELVVTRLQAGQGPFVLRLPLGRHNSMDADEEVFGFEQGRSELSEIIKLANESAHSSRDTNSKEAKIAWWEEREELDARLKDLLENIEKVWLGGFTGIFSQHALRPDLLARFQKSFQNILNKHLPSRQKTKKRNASPCVTLDPRILDLFIGLGDASVEDADFSEPLTDLLYFVIDVLQFQGELNAYAEIDFDSIVVETQDALRYYHEAVHASSGVDDRRHTVLILDKALHAFPWESIPCMIGQAVSRLPSLGCLRERILLQQDEERGDSREGQYVDRNSGAYVLNPSGDLKNTQATFRKSLQALKEWDGTIEREPSEARIQINLASKDIFLYFGHGSGAQYIRAKEIRKLERCSVAFLMGCSSGTLSEVGEFEPYGPAMNYMHAGCPALVATLWDVTDKDIDRFAKTTFENWDLFEKEDNKSEKKGKGRKKGQASVKQRQSLIEAVSKGREACHLRYLNAAAVCVYGVPVYLR